MNIVLTCPFGLESVAKKEIELLGMPILHSQDRQITTKYSPEFLVKLNLWSRVGNKVYLELAKKDNIDSFDKLFELVNSINWKYILSENCPIIVNATSRNSKLFSLVDIQKISKKAIVNSLKTDFLREDDKIAGMYIEIVIINNFCQVLLDSSSIALHKRGYRKSTVEAPLRENLAAGLVLLSNWRFKNNFYDLFCGSGTIVIEAAMIAKNIAPGLNRNFAFENWKFIDKGILQKEKLSAKKQIYDKKYNIIGSDIDENNIIIAKSNAKLAGVDDSIDFITNDFKNYSKEKLEGNLVSNPPYGIRLNNQDINEFYKDLANFLNFQNNLKSSIITNYELGDLLKFNYKKRKLYNGQEMCFMYRKM